MSTDTDDETGSGIGGNGHALSRLSSNEGGESMSSGGSMSTVLITANVGSIFEEPDQLIPKWHGEITQYLEANKPKFVALHFQEVGHFTEVIRVKTEIRREKMLGLKMAKFLCLRFPTPSPNNDAPSRKEYAISGLTTKANNI